MAYLKPADTVIVDSVSFEKFMDYREKRNLKNSWGWMSLPAGTLLEVKELIFRTTGSRKKRKKFINDAGDEEFKSSRGRSCWVKCSVVTPVSLTGAEHTIPSWVLKKSIVSHEKGAV
tara:strand:+ start:748 stop:1098 length:351 start_codon:yes stop_codon:yes gene_type:complete